MYSVSRLFGGRVSHWYLISPDGHVIDVAHERDEDQVRYLNRVAAMLNVTLQEDELLSKAA